MRQPKPLALSNLQNGRAPVASRLRIGHGPHCASVAVLILALSAAGAAQSTAPGSEQVSAPATVQAAAGSAYADAQRLFYSARYDAAAAMLEAPCTGGDPAACEVRAAALLFRIRREMGEAADRKKAWSQCTLCPSLLAAFKVTNAHGRTLAREGLAARPDDEETLFLLSKLALNHVWLELGVLGHKTGWSEYWEARKTLDRILARNPGHVRARVARAWIDYIVDTKMPRGTRWVLGGGSKKRGLLAVREAANTDARFFDQAEARFALWDMQVRERNIAGAVATARTLVRDFPENSELHRFLGSHDGSGPR